MTNRIIPVIPPPIIMHRQIALLLGLTIALAHDAGGQSPDSSYDIVIRNGRVLDGEGNPWIAADVAIKDGHFARIGRVAGHGKTEIDARGKYVSPGWIDMMDQSGGVLPRNGLAENKVREGVTTAIGGEGGTPVPASRSRVSISRRSSGRESASTSAPTSARRSARRGARSLGARTNAGGARPHARDHGYGDARRRDGYDDRAHLPAVQLLHHRRAGGSGQGGCAR